MPYRANPLAPLSHEGFIVYSAGAVPQRCLESVKGIGVRRTPIVNNSSHAEIRLATEELEGIVDANIVPDDTYRHVEHGSVETVKSTRDGILLIVEALDPLASAGGSERREG